MDSGAECYAKYFTLNISFSHYGSPIMELLLHCFMDEETEVWRRDVVCPWSQLLFGRTAFILRVRAVGISFRNFTDRFDFEIN